MIGGPSLSGAAQVTRRLDTEAADTFGAPGAPGASVLSSVTVTVMVWVAVFSRSPSPLLACTVTS